MAVSSPRSWPRPVPTVGDTSTAGERSDEPSGWRFSEADRAALGAVIAARRDIRRFRPDPVPDELLDQILASAHQAPSVGHSQPWRFVVIRDPGTRIRAAALADQARLIQAAAMDPESGRHLLDLDLEGIREAPIGIVVCCDRRSPAEGVLGRATFREADIWSCACAIENLWLTARAAGVGVGWVTLFEPDDLAGLVDAPAGVVTLGWLCVGWPDERPPAPGLERRGWSARQPLDQVVMFERWPGSDRPPPASRLAPPTPVSVVRGHDSGDDLLAAPGSLGVLDRAVDKVLAVCPEGFGSGTLVLAAADHPVAARGVSAYPQSVTATVVEASLAGVSVGAVAARSSGLAVVVVDAGINTPEAPTGAVDLRPGDDRGDLVTADALSDGDAARLVEGGRELGRSIASGGLVALGEIGIGNTTVAVAVAAALLGTDPESLVGLGASSDSATVAAKKEVVAAALSRVRAAASAGPMAPMRALAGLGGGELAALAGVVIGAASAGAVVVLDGLATSVAALAAVRLEPAVAAHLVAGQRSRETAHPAVLQALGLEPLIDLRLRTGEGVGASLAVGLLHGALSIRLTSAKTTP